MIRYNLDDLGWYQFEWLCQSLLKAELGIGVEAWGQRADHGRDAYCPGPLCFPSKQIKSDGPFVFQCKFVEQANAAGAVTRDLLLGAVKRETKSIAERVNNGEWKYPRHYILLTNAPITANLRDEIAQLLAKYIEPTGDVYCLAGTDLCDLLDNEVELRRSFPQLLSLRDLDRLIDDTVNRETIERSKATIACARDLVGVFVPTSQYSRAWSILHKFNFVVLSGPPEVGKTTIAWMIGLTQLMSGWDSIICLEPADFFKTYCSARNQVFITDDAFGRTEYDPARGKVWESQINLILQRLDSGHWLIWTSRKHILEQAIKKMDLQGPAAKFPEPAALLVDASLLSIREKALMIYRHCKASGLEQEAKSLIKEHAKVIIYDNDFTPERIRLLTRDVLPRLSLEMNDSQEKRSLIGKELLKALRNPTEHMKKTYSSLPEPHKWLLISTLDLEAYALTEEQVEKSYRMHCPEDIIRPYSDVSKELFGTFISSVEIKYSQTKTLRYVDLIHPSYRDLLIEELKQNPAYSLRFLSQASIAGIKLAISTGGGYQGERVFPLMISPGAWEALSRRCIAIAATEVSRTIQNLLQVLVESVKQAPSEEVSARLLGVIKGTLQAIYDRYNSFRIVFDSGFLSTYSEASVLVSPLMPLPNLMDSWINIDLLLKESSAGDDFDKYSSAVLEWLSFLECAINNEPRFLRLIGFPDNHVATFDKILASIEEELGWDADFDSAYEAYFDYADTLDSLRVALTKACTLLPNRRNETERVAGILDKSAELARDRGARGVNPDEDRDDDEEKLGKLEEEAFIEELLSDV